MDGRHHHLADVEVGLLLAGTGVTYLAVSLFPLVSYAFWSSFLLSSVIYYEAFCLWVATNFFSIPVFHPKLELY